MLSARRTAEIEDLETHMLRVLASPTATDAEKAWAGGWLFAHGWYHLEAVRFVEAAREKE